VEVEEFEVPDELKTEIFRILQEAMNNAAKHSKASRVTVALKQVLGDLQLVVGDDGVGFSPEEHRRRASDGGFGLVSMRERAELFGGSLILTSESGEGTMVLARWELSDV
jgi:two-component system NarL family sensor kinase